MDYIVRQYLPGDEEEIVKVLKIVFPGWGDLEFWKWLYQDNPLKIKAIAIAVAVIDKEIVGVSLSIPLKMKILDKIVYSLYGTDSGVYQEYRGKGIFTKMDELKTDFNKKNNINFRYHHTSNPIILKYNIEKYGKTLWYIPVTHYIRIQNINEHIKKMKTKNALIKKIGYKIIKMLNKIWIFNRNINRHNNKIYLYEINNFDNNINVFWESISENYNFIVVRTKDYLNWRYCDPRSGKYIIKKATDKEGKILGYVVLSILKSQQEDYPIGCIFDLLALQNRLDVIEALVSDAIYYFSSKNINVIEFFFIKRHPYVKVLKRYGFIDTGKQGHHFVLNLDLEDEIKKIKLSSSDKIYFSHGDIAY